MRHRQFLCCLPMEKTIIAFTIQRQPQILWCKILLDTKCCRFIMTKLAKTVLSAAFIQFYLYRNLVVPKVTTKGLVCVKQATHL